MEAAVVASELTKVYKLYKRPIDRLIEIVTGSERHAQFPALDGVSFEVERGETIGIIGQNGAGKSTLLKLLCGVTTPTTGSLQMRGTIASILELGTGFHPEFTGRENAAVNAAILGLSPSEVRKRLPAILEFSELGTFLDRPVKTYSSGMFMRLAFSVAVNVDPDILVIDEALAVGDGHFQKKCIDKIREFQEAGKTILFCSHALYYVSSVCRRTLWLDHGTMMRYGPSLDVVHDYESFLLARDRDVAAAEAVPEAEPRHTPVRFLDVEVVDRKGMPRELFQRGEDVIVRMRVQSDVASQPIHVIVSVDRSADGLQCFVVGTHADGIPPLVGKNEYDFAVELHDMPLLRGDYSIVAFVGDEHALTAFDRRDIRPAFAMAGERYDIGLVEIPHHWQLGDRSSDAHSALIATHHVP